MKTIVKILSWASYMFIGGAMAVGAMYWAALVCDYLRDLVPYFQGRFTCLWLFPIHTIIALSIVGFFILGLKQYARSMQG